MQTIRDKDCEKCGLSRNCKNPCLMNEGQKGKLMIILDNPTRDNDDTNTIAEGFRDRALRMVLDEAIKVKPDEVYITYLVKCAPLDTVDPKQGVKPCFSYLMEEIERVQPTAILCLGTLSTEVFFKRKIGEARGLVEELETEYGVVKLIASYSPAYIGVVPEKIEDFAKDVYKAYGIAYNIENTAPSTVSILCDTMDKVRELFSYVIETGVFCFDYETTTLKDRGVFDADFKATLISVAFQQGCAYAIPLYHFETPFTEEEIKEILSMVGKILADPDIEKIGHNIKFDLEVSWVNGLKVVRGRLQDTMLIQHLLNEDLRKGLKDILPRYYPDLKDYEADVKKYAWEKVPLSILVPYACTDADGTLRLVTQLESELLKDPATYRIYRNEVMYALKSIIRIEMNGNLIDVDGLVQRTERAQQLVDEQEGELRKNKKVKKFELFVEARTVDLQIKMIETKLETAKGKRLEKLQKDLDDLKLGRVRASEPLNFDSPKQLGELLYSKEGFGFKKVWDKKKRAEAESTGKDTIADFKDPSGFIDGLLVYRSLQKTLGTYLKGMYKRLSQDYLHADFKISGTESGRIACANPNLQNLPNEGKIHNDKVMEVVSSVKKCFIAKPNSVLMQVDYSQAELRVIASFAQEDTMLQVFRDGIDIHAMTASKMMGISIEDFYKLSKEEQKEKRRNAKAGNFGLIYGMAWEGFISYAKSNYGVILDEKQSKSMIKLFFRTYPYLIDYHTLYIAKAQKYGYVRTLFGRKRHTPQIKDRNEFVRSMDERVAINSPIQGSAGELTIFAIALLTDRLDSSVSIINTVHDSIVLDVPEHLVDSTALIVRDTCVNLPIERFFKATLEGVEMAVDIEISRTNWKELEAYKFSENIG